MKPGAVAAQLVIFALISVGIVVYTLFGVIQVDPTSTPITVKVQLPTGGGVFERSEVAYRGVGVGRVTKVSLGRSRVTVTLSLDEGTRVPADSVAHIYDLSVAGEQYVDLVPRSSGGPVLRSGAVIPAERTTTPISIAQLLLDVEQLVTSLNPDDIRTVTRELALAFANSGTALRTVLDAGGSIVKQLSDSREATVRLAHNGRVVLDTLAKHTGDFREFAQSLDALTGTLKSSTPTFEKLIEQSPATVTVLDQLVRDTSSSAAVLMSNLVTLGGIQVANIPGLKALLVAVPEFGRLLPTVVRDGRIQAALLVNYSGRICASGVPLTSPISGTRSPIYKASCNDAKLLPRGAVNAPASGSRTVNAYDPETRIVHTDDGSSVRLGSTGGQDELFGDKSWKTLLMPGGTP